jgi:ACS family hexuronate transporter-like MFS transporter
MEPPASAAPAVAPAVAVAPADAAELPLSRYRFVMLGVVWCAYLVVFLSRLCVGPLAPFLKDAFDLSNAQIGGLTSATAVAYAPTLIFAGWLVDRIGVRRALLIGTVITGLCIGAVALAPSYGTMLLLLGASGLGCGFIYPTAVKAIMLWFPPRERATAVGVNQSAVNVSGMMGAAVMPWLAVAYGWQAGFVFAAGLAFVVCVVAVLFYRDPRPDEWSGRAAAPLPVSEIDQGLPAVTGDEQTDKAVVKSGFVAVLRSRDIWMMGLAALFLGVVEFAALAHLVLFLNTDWGYSVAVAAGMLAFCQFAGAIGKPLSGLVSDRPLHRRRVPALLGMGTLAGLSCVAFALLQPGHEWLLWGALFLLGFGAVGWGGLMGTLAGETGGDRAAGAAAGVSAAFFNVGIFLGPPIFGYIVDRTGSYPQAWWTMAGSAAVALVLLLFVREGRTVG